MYELRKETGTTFVYAYDGTHGEIKAFDFLYSHVMYHEGFKYYVGIQTVIPKGLHWLKPIPMPLQLLIRKRFPT